MKHILSILTAITLTLLAASCIEDTVSTSPAHQPTFSTDTVRMGTLFTDQPTPTFALRVYNPHPHIISISSISLRDPDSPFRINVDGLAGTHFSNIEIRPQDSIYILIDANFPPHGNFSPATVTDHIDLVTAGVTSSIPLSALTSDIQRLRAHTITADTVWESDRPRQILDSLVIAPGATLTLRPGAKLLFHDRASLIVHGTLITDGTPDQPVILTGDRTGNVITDVSFDIMSRQWEGVYISPSSRNSTLSYTEIRNTVTGLTVDSTATLSITASRLRNSGSTALLAYHASITASSTEFAEAPAGPLVLIGGTHTIDHCTLSNYYLFAPITAPLLTLIPPVQASVTNSILYGSSADISPADLSDTQVTVSNTILRSQGTDDEHFISCHWNTDPLFLTDRAAYIFDYRLLPASPAIGLAAPSPLLPPTDFYGVPRTTATLGAYEPTQP